LGARDQDAPGAPKPRSEADIDRFGLR